MLLKVEGTVQEINKYFLGDLTSTRVFIGDELFTCDHFLLCVCECRLSESKALAHLVHRCSGLDTL